MREIKAYVRQHRIADVLDALRNSGLCDVSGRPDSDNITVVRVERPVAEADLSQQRYSLELAVPIVAEFKLELVCSDDRADALVDVITKAARTGSPEAGWVFVSEIERAVEIR